MRYSNENSNPSCPSDSFGSVQGYVLGVGLLNYLIPLLELRS